MQEKRTSTPQGIRVRHSAFCPTRSGGECTVGSRARDVRRCSPSYEGFVYDPKTRTKVRSPSFKSLSEARTWRVNARSLASRRALATPTRRTVREAWESWLAKATTEPPKIVTRSGKPYKPSLVRSYESSMRLYVLDDLGALRLEDVTKRHLRDLVERMIGEGRSPSTIRNSINPIRCLYRYEGETHDGLANPTTGLRLPAVTGRRERAAGLDELDELIGLVPEADRPIWWCAALAGLRLGELRALRWSDLSLADSVIRVSRSWDQKVGVIAPKSKKGTRAIPILLRLNDILVAHKQASGREGDALVFGATATQPFSDSNLRRKSKRAWARENKRRAAEAEERGEETFTPVVPIGLHECRHSFVSFAAESGLSLEEIGDLVGHSSAWMSDQYRHLRDARRDLLAAKLNEYALVSSTRQRIEQLGAVSG